MKKFIAVPLIAASLVACNNSANSSTAAPSEKTSAVALTSSIDKAGYGAAYRFAEGMLQSGVKPSVDAIILGVRDAAAKQDMRISDADMQAAFADVRKQIEAQADAESAAALSKGKEFLEKNKTAEGVVVTDSGLQYKVVKAAEASAAKPTSADVVQVHYTGKLIDGTEFDSSVKRGTPAEFPVTGVIKGWTEALQLMGKGAKWTLYIPADLAYGERGAGSIPPNSTLVFDVELLDINPEHKAAEAEAEAEAVESEPAQADAAAKADSAEQAETAEQAESAEPAAKAEKTDK